MDTQNPAKTSHHKGRMILSIVGARLAAAIGGGGGSIVAKGSRLESRFRIPGRISRAATITTNGIDGTTAAFQKLFGGMYPWSTVVEDADADPHCGGDRQRPQQCPRRGRNGCHGERHVVIGR